MQKEIKETILCFVDEIQREELVNTLELLIEKKLSPSLYELEMKWLPRDQFLVTKSVIRTCVLDLSNMVVVFLVDVSMDATPLWS